MSYSLIDNAAGALGAVAAWARANADKSAWSGSEMPSLAESAMRRRDIGGVVDAIEALAIAAEGRQIMAGEFEPLLARLHELGVFPDGALVSAVARLVSGGA